MLELAFAAVRAWTRLYTAGLPSDVRDARRAEIDSDLWECRDDVEWGMQEPWRAAATVVVRLLFGVPDDLSWRLAQADSRSVGVAMMLSAAPQIPVTKGRRLSTLLTSATFHLVAILLAVWVARMPARTFGLVETREPVIVSIVPELPHRAARRPAAATPGTPPDLNIQLDGGRSSLALPGFTLDFSRVIRHASLLFPFLTGSPALDRVIGAESVRRRTHLTSPLAARSRTGERQSLELSDTKLQALVDRAWSRRDRWQAFAPLAALLDRYDPDEGRLPDLVRAYVEQDGLQPYLDTDIRDPRLWVQLGVAADHTDFIECISRFAAVHPSTRVTTDLLLLLDQIAQAELSALATLVGTDPLQDLQWTAAHNRDAFAALSRIRDYYRAWLTHRDVTSPSALTGYYDVLRLRILRTIVASTPGGYRAGDARFLIGEIDWRAGRRAAALRAWRRIVPGRDDAHAAAYEAIQALGPAAASQPRRVDRILSAERGRWISDSFDRLRHFGYRFDTF